MLADVDNHIERDACIRELESLLGIRARAIYDQIAKVEAQRKLQKRIPRNRTGNYRYNKNIIQPVILKPGYIRAEAHLVNLMVQGKNNAEKILQRLNGLTLQEPLHQKVVDIVKGLLDRKADVSEALVLSYLEDKNDIKKLVEIFEQKLEYDNIDAYIDDCLNQVEMGILAKKRQEIKDEINAMDQKGISDPDRYKSLLKEMEELNLRLNAYKSERRELRE